MNKAERRAELKDIQHEADAIRAELGISPPGAILYLAPPDLLSDDTMVVEADGFGGATTRVVEGNFPVDYCAKYEKSFETEREAEQAAQQIADGKQSPALVLGAVEAQVT